MLFIVIFLSLITLGSFIWTVIQIIKPEWFYRAEQEANLKRKRPWWYLMLGIAGLVMLFILWYQAFQLKLISVWILTAIFTLGSVKGLGMVFFYNKFSGGVTTLISKMQASKRTYAIIVISRGLLSLISFMATLYFAGMLGSIR